MKMGNHELLEFLEVRGRILREKDSVLEESNSSL